MRLRPRLLLAFLLVSVPPVLLMALLIVDRASRSFEDAADARLRAALRATRSALATARNAAAAQVAAAALDLPATAPPAEGDIRIATLLAHRHGLEALEIVDADGKTLSSHHWPAGFGLDEDDDEPVAGDPELRVERTAEGYGAAERLSLMPSRRLRWRGKEVLLRGGRFLDGEFLADASMLTGAEIALRHAARSRWFARPGSPLLDWGEPGFSTAARTGTLSLGAATLRWSAEPLAPTLWLVAAMPRTELDAVTAEVRRTTLLVAGTSMLLALAAAAALSARIARPARDLLGGVRRVARGDLDVSVETSDSGEIGDLARAFNRMTAELRASRERLVQAERVAAWREMSRRLAHDLKNPLFPIQLSVETLRKAFESEASAAASPALARLMRESTDTVLDELRRLRKVVEDFGALSRAPRPQMRPTDVNAVVRQVSALYEPRAAGVRVETSLAPGLPAVPADRDLLARALGNLVANALDAMPGGGSLRLRTAAEDGGVRIEVEDTGPGLGAEERSRLFTPYYTTKSGGTGLGLAIVQGIVSDHGGRIEVRSQPGKGTAFALLLPAEMGREMLAAEPEPRRPADTEADS
jgi:nitrogen fixation/metabolism regulation signal transduction histidine kinase